VLNLTAKIIPGESAGGFTIGMKIDNIPAEKLSYFEVKNMLKFSEIVENHRRFISDNLVLYTTDNIITQIGVFGNYLGKTDEDLGIGNLVVEFEKVYGRLSEGEEDELVFSNLKGLCFEPEYSNFDSNIDWRIAISHLKVGAIFIYKDIYGNNYSAPSI
jgi:hypothetical protein